MKVAELLPWKVPIHLNEAKKRLLGFFGVSIFRDI